MAVLFLIDCSLLHLINCHLQVTNREERYEATAILEDKLKFDVARSFNIPHN